MPQGLQIWDASGNLVVDLTDHFGRLIGYQNVSSSGSFSSSEFSKGTPFYLYLPSNYNQNYPSIFFSGNTLNWTGSSFSGVIYYGVM